MHGTIDVSANARRHDLAYATAKPVKKAEMHMTITITEDWLACQRMSTALKVRAGMMNVHGIFSDMPC